MNPYQHKPKTIRAYDAPTLPAPVALGQPRAVVWTDVYPDVRTIGFARVPGEDTTVMFHATNQSWPREGGRAIVVTGCCIKGGVEVWTREQLRHEIDRHITSLGVSARVANRVWSHRTRADPAPWPVDWAPLVEFK